MVVAIAGWAGAGLGLGWGSPPQQIAAITRSWDLWHSCCHVTALRQIYCVTYCGHRRGFCDSRSRILFKPSLKLSDVCTINFDVYVLNTFLLTVDCRQSEVSISIKSEAQVFSNQFYSRHTSKSFGQGIDMTGSSKMCPLSLPLLTFHLRSVP